MGLTQSTEMRQLLPIEQALAWHLKFNHYPPVSARLIPTALEAIKNARAGDWSAMVAMPQGYPSQWLETSEVIEGLYLSPWLEGGECEEVTT